VHVYVHVIVNTHLDYRTEMKQIEISWNDRTKAYRTEPYRTEPYCTR
jgi:hypothetical protein